MNLNNLKNSIDDSATKSKTKQKPIDQTIGETKQEVEKLTEYSKQEAKKFILEAFKNLGVEDTYAASIFPLKKFKEFFSLKNIWEEKHDLVNNYTLELFWSKLSNMLHSDFLTLWNSIWLSEISEKEQKTKFLALLAEIWIKLDDMAFTHIKSNSSFLWKQACTSYVMEKACWSRQARDLKKKDFLKLCDYFWVKRIDKKLKKEKLEKNVKQFLASKWIKHIDDLAYVSKSEFLKFFENKSFRNYLEIFWIKKSNFTIQKALNLTNNFGLTKKLDDRY